MPFFCSIESSNSIGPTHVSYHVCVCMCTAAALRISNRAADTFAGSSMVERCIEPTSFNSAVRSPTLWLFFILWGLFLSPTTLKKRRSLLIPEAFGW